MDISVIIPSYKPQDYLWRCLESLDSQTLSKNKFEIILILNGCCEPWKGQIDTWTNEHSNLNINFIQTDTPGVSNARNLGIDAAKGEYITFIDDDDFVSPMYLESMWEKVDGKSVVLTDSFAFYEENPDKIIESYAPHQCYKRHHTEDNCNLLNVRAIFNGPWMKLIKASYINNIRYNKSLKIGEDSIFMFAISKNVKHIRFAGKGALYYRRYRRDSAITTKRPVSFWIKNCLKMQALTIGYWIKNPFEYNFKFSISRFLAPLKAIKIH